MPDLLNLFCYRRVCLAAGVGGGGLIALTATLSTIGHIPAVGIMLIFGIDKFMSECRALVNFIGNTVAPLFIAKWNREFDVDRVRLTFAGEVLPATGGDRERLRHGDSRTQTPARRLNRGPRGPENRHDTAITEPAGVRLKTQSRLDTPAIAPPQPR